MRFRSVFCGCVLLALTALIAKSQVCQPCHPKEVAAYLHSGMARSLRRPGKEPAGSFTTRSGTRFTIRAGTNGLWQRMERFGGAAEYRVGYVLGSGAHASSYLIQIRDHLFQSPVCYYTGRAQFDVCPGYDQTAEPDFTRPVGEECVLCHSGQPRHVRDTTNRYEQPPFQEDAISCERCHGSAAEHLKLPVPGSIVNPAKLAPAARDSVCEQCHLAGATQRILNPGKDFANFHPGQPLEEVFTVYTRTAGRGLKVINHAEQLALSACARGSEGKMWCGTCHDPHAPAAPAYNSRCQRCHEGKLAKSHPSGTNCVSCHMSHRPTQDGAHTVFTDHRIRRTPEGEDERTEASDELRPWRLPAQTLQPRNLGLAYVNAGLADRSPAEIARGYRMLAEFQPSAPDDIEVLRAIGRALLAGGRSAEALKAFEMVLKLAPDSATNEEELGTALLRAGDLQSAASHLERAVRLDPLLLSGGTALQEVYRRQGHDDQADALEERMRRTMLGLPLQR